MHITELDSYNLADAVKFNNELNPAIWTGQQMKPEVRAKLLAIADDFREFLGLTDLEVKDITVSGSNAAYTYTPHSDIDLHLVVDIPQADNNEVYRELFDAKKYQYNDLHNITIGGYDVELYVEDARKQPVSQGIYSVKNNDWVKIPLKRRADINDEAVKSKFEDIGHRIESALKEKDSEKIDALARKIKNFRQAGLDKSGEFGPENLAYKMLRKQGLIKQLYDARAQAKDAELSLKERNKIKQPVVYGYKTEDLDTDGVMMTRPTNCSSEAAVPEAKPSDEDILKDFIDFVSKELKLKELPIIKLRKDPQWSVVHKTFGRYVDDRNMLEVAWGQRHIMDVLRTVAHELTHRRQHEREAVPHSAGETGSPYENEANARAGILMRDYARLHPEYFEAGQAEQLHGDEVKESYADYFRTSAPVAAVKPTRGTMNIAGYRVDYDAKNKSIIISQNGKVLHQEGGTSTGQGRPITTDAIAARARRIINQLEGDAVDEGVKEKLGALAAAACIAGTPGCATTDIQSGVRAAQTIGNLSQIKRGNIERALGQDAKNVLRRAAGQVQNEGASGYIPTKKQAKDPRFSMALTQDIKPGQVGKEANKLDLETDSQGHPKLLIKGLANALREFKETGQLPKNKKSGYTAQPLTQEPGGIEDNLGNQEATGPEFPPEFPRGTTKIDVSDTTDWYRLGMDISDMDDADPADYNQGPPQTIVVYPNKDAETYYNKQLNRLGLKTSKASGSTKLSEDEQLDEVKMSPGALKKFAASPEAKGIMAGFEAELIFRDTQGNDDMDDYEADYDSDERCYDINQVVEFFENDDYGYGLSERRANRLRNDLEERYFEWWDERMYEAFRDEQDDLIRDLLLEDKPMDERVHDALTQGHDYSDEEADKIIAAGGKAPRFTRLDDQEIYAEQNPDYEAYLQATEDAEAILEEEVQASIDNQDSTYDQAVENFREGFQTDDSDFFTDVGLRWMSSVASDYDLDWPIMSGGGGNGGSRDWSDIAHDLEQVTGKRVVVGSSYHSARRKPNEYVLEPDSSLSPDDREDFGLELVSPPMPLDEAIEQLNAIVDWANTAGDAYTNSSTGLHMGVSIPYKGGDVDYLKLITFLGDQYVLEKFGRSANTYCDSAMKKLKQNVAGSKNRGDDKIAGAMELMKHGLIELAQKYVQQGVGNSKYTSAHIKPGYIEFRSPGGDYLSQADRGSFTDLEDTMRRFAYAMYLAGRPDLERKEYYKKLYKLIAPEGNKDLELFSKFSSGEITAEELKKQWAEKVIAKEVPVTGKEKSNWKLYNRSTGKPVEGLEWNNYTELDALERAKARVSPASSMMDFKQAYELRDVGTNTGRWSIIRRDNNETLEVVDAATRGEAVDYAYDKYTDVIPFYVEPVSGDTVPGKWDIVEKGTNRVIDTIDAKSASEAAETAFAKDYDEDWYTRPHSGKEPEPKLSRRAKLATQIARPKDYVLVNKHSGLPFYTFSASSLTQAVDFGLDYLRNKGLEVENFSVQRASNVKQSIDNAVDSKQLQQRVEGPHWELVYAPTGRVIDTISGVGPTKAGQWREQLIRDHGFRNPDDIIVRRVETSQVQDVEPDVAQNFSDPGQAQRVQNIRDAAPRADFELYVHDRPEEVLHSMDNATAEEVREFIARQERSGMPPGLLRVRQVTNETYNRSQQQKTQLALDTLAQKSGFKNFAAVPQGKVRIDIMRKAVDLLKKNTL